MSRVADLHWNSVTHTNVCEISNKQRKENTCINSVFVDHRVLMKDRKGDK